MPMEILPEIWKRKKKRTFLANSQLTIRKQQAEIWRFAAFNSITMVSFLFNNRQFLEIFFLVKTNSYAQFPPFFTWIGFATSEHIMWLQRYAGLLIMIFSLLVAICTMHILYTPLISSALLRTSALFMAN